MLPGCCEWLPTAPVYGICLHECVTMCMCVFNKCQHGWVKICVFPCMYMTIKSHLICLNTVSVGGIPWMACSGNVVKADMHPRQLYSRYEPSSVVWMTNDNFVFNGWIKELIVLNMFYFWLESKKQIHLFFPSKDFETSVAFIWKLFDRKESRGEWHAAKSHSPSFFLLGILI